MNFIKRLLRSERTLSGFLIIALGMLAYLPFINQMGYYGDDWHIAWAGHTIGYSKVANIYSTDRPFMGFVYSINYLVLGDPPLNWQLYAVFQRLIGGLAFFWILSMVWPNQRRATSLMAVLLTIYPGFLLMPNASTYQTLLFGINLGLLSIGCSLRFLISSNPREKSWMAILSGLLAMGTVFMFEWFISLEGLRIALIWYVLGRDLRQQFRKKTRGLVKYWLPALTGIGAFVFWRVLFFHNQRHATNLQGLVGRYLNNPLNMLLRIPAETLRSIGETLLSAWLVPLYNLILPSEQFTRILLTILAGMAAVLLLVVCQSWLDKQTEKLKIATAPDLISWERPAIAIGAFNVLTALLVVVLLDRSVSLRGDTFDRYTLTSMPGVALMLVGAIFLVIKSPRFQIGAIAFLAGLAVMTHFANAGSYSDITAMQREFWWQLAWRAPDLKTGTLLMPGLRPRGFTADYDIFPEANLIYRPQIRDVQIGAEVLNRETAILAILGKSSSNSMRTISYPYNFTKLLVATFGYGTGVHTCMHLIDNHRIELTLNEAALVSTVAQYSKADQVDINAQSHTPPLIFFGPEPSHTWCYYYEKASLARQRGDWQEVARLGDQAASLGYTASDLIEWSPFLEAYAILGQTEKVRSIATLIRQDSFVGHLFCVEFSPTTPPPNSYRSIDAFKLVGTELCR